MGQLCRGSNKTGFSRNSSGVYIIRKNEGMGGCLNTCGSVVPVLQKLLDSRQGHGLAGAGDTRTCSTACGGDTWIVEIVSRRHGLHSKCKLWIKREVDSYDWKASESECSG